MRSVELVGILNVTPDSFSGDGIAGSVQLAVEHAYQLDQDGASFIDVGAESTRPGATPIDDNEEWRRLEPVLPDLFGQFGDQVSIDTHHPETVRRARELGNFIINDVTAFNNPEMITVAAESELMCIVSHLPAQYGTDIQSSHRNKTINSVNQVRDELLTRRQQMIARGVLASRIILDPGIGFGKSKQANWDLLRFAELVPDIPVMIGYSRKPFLGDNNRDIEQNLIAGRIAVESGARYLRVHDVAGHAELIN